jgi:thioredoxin-like negative regulator of GroEL
MFPAVNELARQRAGLLKVGSVNTEQAPFLARQFNVMSVPRLMLFRAGRVIADTSGAMRKDQIEGWIDHSVR